MTHDQTPQTPEAFLTKLTVVTDRLPKRLRQCADHVATHPERIAVSTVAELAEGAGVQPSAFMRFCREMGFSGFSQMQRLFREDYAQRWPDYQTRLKSLHAQGSDSAGALLAEFIEAGRLSVEKLAQSVDPGSLDEAASVLSRARTIHLVGSRRAFPVVSYLSYAFEKMDIPAVLASGVGNLGAKHLLIPGDAMIAVSFAPYTEATLDLAREANARKLPVVTITDLVTSPLLRFKSAALLVNEIEVGAFRTLSATLTLAMMLAVAVGAHRSGT
jgi:DNA-binding MurR/RpiR family transcriptional regulator